MSPTTFILRSALHYRRLNWMVILGIALSAAILTGALIVGDSVKFSLQQIAQERLGKTTRVITAGERIFGSQLAKRLAINSGASTAALLRTDGFAILQGGESRINQLAVWGIDADFSHFGTHPITLDLKENQVAINENLATQFGLKQGDELLLRVNKLNTFPANTPFVSVADNRVAFRVVIKTVLSTRQLGNLNLRNIQSSPRNLFLNLDWLNQQMGLQGKANVVLLSNLAEDRDLDRLLKTSWSMEELNLQIRENDQLNYTELISDRVFIEPAVEQFCTTHIQGAGPIFSYFSNRLNAHQLQTPYSFVSSDSSLADNQIVVNEWLANDLKLKPADSLRIAYFRIGAQRQLKEAETALVVSEIVPIAGKYADKLLMPVIPGLSDAGNCRDWKTGVPVDLKKIRQKDEDYWKQFGGTPKAFVSLNLAKKLWGNRFGHSTAIRFNGLKKEEIAQSLLKGVSPAAVGLETRAVREEGLVSASNGVDFGQLFIGLSFFVLAAAILLTHLLFQLFMNYRRGEMATLYSMGFSISKIRRIFLTESAIYLVLGILLGIPLSIGYNYLILKAINTIWVDIVRTSIVHVQITATSLVAGNLVIIIGSLITVWFSISKRLKLQLVQLQRKAVASTQRGNGIISAIIASLLIAISLLLLLVKGIKRGEIDPELFFISGFLLLPGMILLVDSSLRRLSLKGKGESLSLFTFRLNRWVTERGRILQIISFLSIGLFLVVSTGLNRKDVAKNANLPASGSGGYHYWIETAIPVLTDLSSPKGREEFDLPDGAQIVSFQRQSGDDASCLNLNKIVRPGIIACDPAVFDQQQAFSFASHSEELDEQHPWLSLTRKLQGGVIPVIADQTVIQWGLMKKVGDTLQYRNEAGLPLQLKLIGGLRNSVFQGSLLMDGSLFAREFPSVSGSTLFLLKLPETHDPPPLQPDSWRGYGPELTQTTARLLQFYQIENTYLNIFLMLGAIGLLIGTLGFGILVFRITHERIPEFALLAALGFNSSFSYRNLLLDHLLILVVSIFTGIIPAILSGLPTLLAGTNPGLGYQVAAIALLVAISGMAFSYMAVRLALRHNLISALRND